MANRLLSVFSLRLSLPFMANTISVFPLHNRHTPGTVEYHIIHYTEQQTFSFVVSLFLKSSSSVIVTLFDDHLGLTDGDHCLIVCVIATTAIIF